ncbi:hypothetical protein M3Y99_00363500 [Aphelenchoides fujianensis]|nr:hypothetical protein M3Y99_00363500 [Aphelenchoides fujianensis]
MDATISRTALLLAAFGLLSVLAFDRDFCEFATTDYSLEWAYEPQSQNAVFVLKLNTTKSAFWTGVGFNGSRKAVDFVGILVRNHQVALADAYINSSGVLYTDVVSNVRTIGHEYDGEHLLVKFARPLVSPDINNDQSLDGCVTFLLPRQPGDVESHGIRPHLDEFHRFKVCDIRKHCEIQMTQEKPTKKPKEEVKFAKSVDVSGLGDPCSFSNENYVVNWTYAKPTDTVHFTMKFPLKSGKWWSAVGIGDTMADMDIGVIFVESGKAKKIGDYLSSSYGVPDQDDHEDWKLEGSTQKNGMVELRFSRKVETDDKEGDQCDPQKEDLAVCQSYMDNYMVQVREWAARHNEPMEAQYGKACALLSAVPHVPSLCCHIYSTTCKDASGPLKSQSYSREY